MNKYNVQKCLHFDKKTNEVLRVLTEAEARNRNKRVTESEYVRTLLMQAKQEQMGIPKNTLTKMSRDMAGCGNNINQIAHRVNMDMYTLDDVRSLRKCMDDISEIRRLLSELMKELY